MDEMDRIIKQYKRALIYRIVLLVIMVGGIACGIITIFFPVLYPVNSKPNTLTVVDYGGFWADRPRITLRNYVNNLYNCEYILQIVPFGVFNKEPQVYDLPIFYEGSVEAIVEILPYSDTPFIITYGQVSDLYENGLLIYMTFDDGKRYGGKAGDSMYNLYVYLVTGEDIQCYYRDRHTLEWALVDEYPKMKRIPSLLGFDDRSSRPPDREDMKHAWRELAWIYVDENTPYRGQLWKSDLEYLEDWGIEVENK